MGMYALGFPVGLLIDSRGPRIAVVMGMLFLAAGYFPLHEAYDNGFGSVALFCFFSSMTGLGGCMSFTAAMKTSAANWPHHRGTATAFPISAFGLSAFFFSTLGAVLFTDNTSAFLMLLACGTSGLVLSGLFFLRVLPYPHHPVASSETTSLHRRKLSDASGPPAHAGLISTEPGTSFHTVAPAANSSERSREDIEDGRAQHFDSGMPAVGTVGDDALASETTSLLSSDSSLPGEVLVQSSVDMDRSHRVDIRGLRLLPLARFWQLFALLACLAGVGLMTIKYVHQLNLCCKRDANMVAVTSAMSSRLFGGSMMRPLTKVSS